MKFDVAGREAYAYTGGRPFDPARPVVVFVHGAQHDHSVWILQSRYLAHHGYSVLAVDLPGHGRSAGPVLASVDAMGEWILALLAAAGADRASVVGHSMGSLIALEAAGRAPERIERVALIAAAFPMKVSDALLAGGARRRAARLRDDQPVVAQRREPSPRQSRTRLFGLRREPAAHAAPGAGRRCSTTSARATTTRPARSVPPPSPAPRSSSSASGT